jgi:membrane protease YdiL (CAAX protease family)
MKLSRPPEKPLLVLLVKSAVFLLFILTLVTASLYGFGSTQNYLDSTQILLLRILSITSLLLVIGSSYGILLDGGMLWNKRKGRYIFGLLVYLFLGLLGLGITILSSFIRALMAGNSH